MIFGEIPIGMDMCHKCDNPSCVNPDHLFVGTHQENMIDSVLKGRHGTKTKPWTIARGKNSANGKYPENVKHGSAHVNAKLTDEIVIYLRANKGKKSSRQFAKQFGMSYSVINQVLAGKAWMRTPQPEALQSALGNGEASGEKKA